MKESKTQNKNFSPSLIYKSRMFCIKWVRVSTRSRMTLFPRKRGTPISSRIDLGWLSRSADHPLHHLRWPAVASLSAMGARGNSNPNAGGTRPRPIPRPRCFSSRAEKCYNASSCLGCGLFSGLWESSGPRGWVQPGSVTHTEADRLGRLWRTKTGAGSSTSERKSQEHLVTRLNPNTVTIIKT